MTIELFWIDAIYEGRVAVCTRPRGGNFLPHDMAALRSAGIDILVSALPHPEAHNLWLADEEHHAIEAGLEFVHFPVPNLLTPPFETAAPIFQRLAHEVRMGKSVAAHCYGGVGRSPLIVASILTLLGEDPEETWERIAHARGREVPDTTIQRKWVSSLKVYCESDPRHHHQHIPHHRL
ncbi:MAG: tyrosine protein phosphatase [Dehalococcoidia bacterium]